MLGLAVLAVLWYFFGFSLVYGESNGGWIGGFKYALYRYVSVLSIPPSNTYVSKIPLTCVKEPARSVMSAQPKDSGPDVRAVPVHVRGHHPAAADWLHRGAHEDQSVHPVHRVLGD